MNRFFRKFGFIHSHLWRHDGFYRAALLFGPAPLLGCMLAGALWASTAALEGKTNQVPRWAIPQGPDVWNTATDQPHTVEPTRPLPSISADGTLSGYAVGWRAAIAPIQVSPTLDVDVKATRLTGFVVDVPGVEMSQIIAEGPKDQLYVGVGSGFLVVRTAGVYALSARLERPAGGAANCLIRLGFGSHRIVSNLEVAMVDDVSKAFAAARFELRPGLYPLGWAFGCWHDQEVTAPGRMILLVGHPGEGTLLPARPDDIVRAELTER
jgi:hypothetical protein